MNKLPFSFLALLFVIHSVAFCAQTSEQSTPTFTLSLSIGKSDGMTPKNLRVLNVKITNSSDHVEYQSFCKAIGGLYDLEVKYNGSPVEETENHKKARLSRESTVCTILDRRIGPGDSKDDKVYFEATKPGTYDFTALQDTSPRDPQRNVTIRSNTVTVVIP
jgi:hypothetical protein